MTSLHVVTLIKKDIFNPLPEPPKTGERDLNVHLFRSVLNLFWIIQFLLEAVHVLVAKCEGLSDRCSKCCPKLIRSMNEKSFKCFDTKLVSQ